MDSRSKALLNGATILLSLFFGFINLSAKVYEVKSPSGKLTLSVSAGTTCTWSLSVGEKQIIKDSRLGLDAGSVVLGDNAVVARRLRGSKTENIEAPFYRQARFNTQYNYLILKMRGGWDLEMRAYDDGVAYRFVTHFKKPLRIFGESLEFQFTDSFETLAPFVIPDKKDRYRSSFENEYSSFKTGDDMGDNLAFTPVYVDIGDAGRLLLMEADLWDYPGMFLKTAAQGFEAEFPPCPSGYLADVDGERTYPWRIVAYAEHEIGLPVNNMVYQLAAPCRIEDTSWIKPGQSSWDWWAGFTLHGVDFTAGINTESYLYAIDFAAKYGLRYILVDAGWYKDNNVFDIADGFDPSRICSYANSKGVGVILWASEKVLGPHPDKIFDHYSKIGVSGFKIDYFDSQDAATVKRVGMYAEVAAKYHLVLDFHGIYKPTGLNRTWPNVLNFEGVFGLEQLKWCNPGKTDMPRHDAIIPYVRMAAGFMDYTPGALRNACRSDFRSVTTRPMSMGTRAHQLACYVCFDSPFTMLCDSPSDYLSEDETTRWISSIPTVFDSSSVLSGKIGEWIVSLREKDGMYFIGGLGSWDERTVVLDFSFLPEGQWRYRLFSDGVNADKVASDYSVSEGTVTADDKMDIHMAPGGGFVVMLEKKEK